MTRDQKSNWTGCQNTEEKKKCKKITEADINIQEGIWTEEHWKHDVQTVVDDEQTPSLVHDQPGCL